MPEFLFGQPLIISVVKISGAHQVFACISTDRCGKICGSKFYPYKKLQVASIRAGSGQWERSRKCSRAEKPEDVTMIKSSISHFFSLSNQHFPHVVAVPMKVNPSKTLQGLVLVHSYCAVTPQVTVTTSISDVT